MTDDREKNLTPAAKRDLQLMREHKLHPKELRMSSWTQLFNAGFNVSPKSDFTEWWHGKDD